MDEVLNALKVQVDSCGLLETAILLGHTNTATLSRWIKSNKIPEGQIKGTKAILDNVKNGKAKK